MIGVVFQKRLKLIAGGCRAIWGCRVNIKVIDKRLRATGQSGTVFDDVTLKPVAPDLFKGAHVDQNACAGADGRHGGQQFMQRIIGLRAGRVVFDGPPEQLTESVLTTIYGAEDWTAMRKDGEADRAAETEAVARLAMISA